MHLETLMKDIDKKHKAKMLNLFIPSFYFLSPCPIDLILFWQNFFVCMQLTFQVTSGKSLLTSLYQLVTLW